MKRYHVSYMCIYSETVYADSPEEAADIVEKDCPYDIDGDPEIVEVENDSI